MKKFNKTNIDINDINKKIKEATSIITDIFKLDPTNISGSPVAYAGGGGGGNSTYFASSGGTGGGAIGQVRSSGSTANAGTVNKGGGGAGSSATPSNTAGVLGGSGVVIIRYKYQ